MDFLKNIYGAYNYSVVDWLLALYLILAGLVVVSVVFGALVYSKRSVILTSVLLTLVFLASLVFYLFNLIIREQDYLGFLDFFIKFFPTFIFISVVLGAIITGARRGLRKSIILYIHAWIAGGISIGLFYYFVHSNSFDAKLLTIVNNIMGSTNALQNQYGLEPWVNTLSQAAVEIILQMLGGNGLDVIFRENQAYLYALVDTVYHIVFTIVAIVIYNLIKAFLYILYFLFYPERRYKKRRTEKYESGEISKPYKKHLIGGSAIGLVRGGLLGLVILSYLGSTLFLFAGTGSGKLQDYDMGSDESSNPYQIYQIYRSIESYGTTGIYKVLNMMTDKEGTPFYLFAADLVFSGELDLDGEKPEHIKWRDEIGTITGFARDTFALLLEYGSEQLKPIMSGESSDFEPILEVFANPEFQTKFESLIANYKEDTHVINMSLALAQSMIDHIDELAMGESLGESAEIVKIVFSKGYLSENIPDDRELMAATNKTKAEGTDIRPYIPVKNLIKKSDIELILNILFKFIGDGYDTEDSLAMVRGLLSDLRGFSLFSEERSAEIDPVFSRIFCLIDNVYLSGDDGMTYTEALEFDVKWTSEIQGLLDVVDSALQLYQNLSGSDNVLDSFFAIFDETDENYEENSALFNTITSYIYNSKVIAIAVSTSYTYNLLSDALNSIYPDVYLSHNLTFTNVYNDDGTIKTEGELYLLFNGLAIIASNRTLVDQFTGGGDGADVSGLLSALGSVLTEEDKNDHNLMYYISSSSMLRSILTAVLTNLDTEFIYIPDAAFETENGVKINVITKEEIQGILSNVESLSDILGAVMSDDGDLSNVLELFGIDSIIRMTESSKILEGSIASVLNGFLTDIDFIVVPEAESEDINLWISSGTDVGEMRRLLEAIKALDLNFGTLMSGDGEMGGIINSFINLDNDQLSTILGSKVLHYTISNMLGGGLGVDSLIVPKEARIDVEDANLSCGYLVTEDELQAVFAQIRAFNLIDADGNIAVPTDMGKILVMIVNNKDSIIESKIIFALIVNTLADPEDGALDVSLDIPQAFKDAAARESLENMEDITTNAWYDEMPALIQAIDEFLGISKTAKEKEEAGEEFEFSFDSNMFEDTGVSDIFKSLNDTAYTDDSATKLEVIYYSVIFKHMITEQLDNLLYGFDAFNDEDGQAMLENEAKDEDGYYKTEELRLLAHAVIIFDFNLTGGGGDDAVMVNHILNKLDEKYDENDPDSPTNLQVVYSGSVIIARMFTYEIDDILNSLIDEDVKGSAAYNSAVKEENGNYKDTELMNFIAAADIIGISDLTGTEGSSFSFTDVKKLASAEEGQEPPIRKVYASTIAAAIISNQLEKALSGYSIHENAFETEIHIFKSLEIESILGLDFLSTDEDGNGGISSITTRDVAQISDLIYNDEGETSSYLLVGILSEMILDNSDNLTIVKEVIDGEYIKPAEIRALLGAFSAFGGDSFGSFEIGADIPTGDELDAIYESVICRIIITETIIETTSSGTTVYLAKRNADSTEEKGKVVIEEYTAKDDSKVLALTAEELKNFVDAMNAFTLGSDFEVPTFDIDFLKTLDENAINTLFASEIMRYQICMVINSFVGSVNVLFETWVASRYGTAENVTSLILDDGGIVFDNPAQSSVVCYAAEDIITIFEYSEDPSSWLQNN